MKPALLVLTLLLSACGGGGGSSGGVVPPPTGCRVSSGHLSLSPKLIAYGDSTMAQTTHLLRDKLSSKNVIVELDNRAVGGTQLHQLTEGSCHYPDGFEADLNDETSAKVVIENYGINDAHFLVRPAEFEAQVRKFVTVVRSAGMIPVLITPVRSLNSAYVPPSQLAMLAQIKRDVAEDMGVRLVDVYSLPVTTADFVADLIHPNTAFYRRIAEFTAKQIKDLL